jgi:hypothetical protein
VESVQSTDSRLCYLTSSEVSEIQYPVSPPVSAASTSRLNRFHFRPQSAPFSGLRKIEIVHPAGQLSAYISFPSAAFLLLFFTFWVLYGLFAFKGTVSRDFKIYFLVLKNKSISFCIPIDIFIYFL